MDKDGRLAYDIDGNWDKTLSYGPAAATTGAKAIWSHHGHVAGEGMFVPPGLYCRFLLTPRPPLALLSDACSYACYGCLPPSSPHSLVRLHLGPVALRHPNISGTA